MAHEYAEYIWNYFKAKLGNEYGVAALMGNLQAESGLCPYRLQGDFTSDYSTSKTYTANVDSGAISRYDFTRNGPGGGGYGLAQWTYYTRKENLYDRWKSGGYDSIGSIELACDFLWWELTNSYTGTYNALKNATSVRSASDYVLHNFENPADQSTAVEEQRAALGMNWYNTYSGTGGSGGDSGGDSGETGGDVTKPAIKPSGKRMSLLLLILATRNRGRS